jgi:TRAP-type C4-dicarboxylate transport system permease small subunit
MRYFAAAVDAVENGLFRVAQVVLVFLMLLSALDALLRYLFSRPIEGGYELMAEYVMPYLVFLAFSRVYKMGGNVRVTVISNHLSSSIQNVLMTIFNIMSIALFCFISYAAFLKTSQAYANGEYSFNVLAYPMWPAYAVVMLGTGLLVLRLLVTVIRRENPYAESELEE